MKCFNCDTELDPGTDVCPICGMDQNHDRKNYYGRKPRDSSNNVGLIIAIFFAVLLIAGAIFLASWIYNKQHSEEPTQNTETVTATVTEAESISGQDQQLTEEIVGKDNIEDSSGIESEAADSGKEQDVSFSAGDSSEDSQNIGSSVADLQEYIIEEQAVYESKRTEEHSRKESINQDLSTANNIKFAVEMLLYEGYPDQVEYLRNLVSDKPLILSYDLVDSDVTGAWNSIFDMMRDYDLTVRYTELGASVFSIGIKDDIVIVYAGTEDEPDKWQLVPDTDKVYIEK